MKEPIQPALYAIENWLGEWTFLFKDLQWRTDYSGKRRIYGRICSYNPEAVIDWEIEDSDENPKYDKLDSSAAFFYTQEDFDEWLGENLVEFL
jgi:hypothetical protein